MNDLAENSQVFTHKRISVCAQPFREVELKDTLNRLSQVRILVMGDLMLDHYQWGDAERISPEAPVPVVRVRREEYRLGGAANVANNLAALGCRVGVCGLVCGDEAGQSLVEDAAPDCDQCGWWRGGGAHVEPDQAVESGVGGEAG